MHNHASQHTSATSAIAMYAGSMFTIRSLSTWTEQHGTGMIETYGQLAMYAAISGAIADGVYDVEGVEFPGVYAYEVDEQFGAAWAQHLYRLKPDQMEDEAFLKQRLADLAWDFFRRIPAENSKARWSVYSIIAERCGTRPAGQRP